MTDLRRIAIIGGFAAAAFGAGALTGASLADRPPAWPSYAEVYERIAPSVVSVELEVPERRVGSGFAVSPTRIVTARHLVVDAHAVTIRGADGVEATARVVGTDARTDLALIEAEGVQLRPAALGPSASLRVGDTVIVVGNPYGLGHSLAVGVVGNLERRLAGDAPGRPGVGFLQLTLPLNPGNSGGPVFDAEGRVVAVLSGMHAQGQAIAFAVPSEALEQALPALEQGEQLSRGFLGVRTEEQDGRVVIAAVVPSGPADRAGLRAGDVLVAIDGEPIGSPAAFHAMLDHLTAGTRAAVRVERAGATLDARVEVSDWAVHPVVAAGMTLRPHPGSGGEIVAVRPRSRADHAGVRVGDVVRSVDGRPMRAPADVQEALAAHPAAMLELVRGGATLAVQLPERVE